MAVDRQATGSFVSNGVFYRKDVTNVDHLTDGAFTADAYWFRTTGGAKVCNTSFVYTTGGRDYYYGAGKTTVGTADLGYIAAPSYFT